MENEFGTRATVFGICRTRMLTLESVTPSAAARTRTVMPPWLVRAAAVATPVDPAPGTMPNTALFVDHVIVNPGTAAPVASRGSALKVCVSPT